MPDLLVPLYRLPQPPTLDEGVTVRRAMAYEKTAILRYVEDSWNERWASELSLAFESHPIRCLVALSQGKLVGFSCYDCTFLGFFGPMGVSANQQGRNLGKALLIRGLTEMHQAGYAYGIIGDVGKALGFYEKSVGALPIEHSEPGAYHFDLRSTSPA